VLAAQRTETGCEGAFSQFAGKCSATLRICTRASDWCTGAGTPSSNRPFIPPGSWFVVSDRRAVTAILMCSVMSMLMRRLVYADLLSRWLGAEWDYFVGPNCYFDRQSDRQIRTRSGRSYNRLAIRKSQLIIRVDATVGDPFKDALEFYVV
jgi:hypothetical protein